MISQQSLATTLNVEATGKEKLIKLLFQLLSLLGIFLGMAIGLEKLQGQYTLFGLAPLSFSITKGWIFFFSNILYGFVAHFSCQYLHKDRRFSKFFLNYFIFWLGLFFFTFSDGAFVLFAGWELIGVSSIFLISYYNYRSAPIFNSLYVVSFYKFADILLITSLLLFKHDDILSTHIAYVPYLYIGIIIAGLIKSGSFPFTPWIPKAMEGPTTSSAIYYGALSVNTGVLLIFFYSEKILNVPVAKNFLLIAGILTVFYSSFQSRVQNNAKALLAYSSSLQIGIILIELAMGLQTLALTHLFTNSFYKVYQFIKSPSLLYSFHEMVGENRSPFNVNGVHFQKIFPKKVRLFLYYLSLHHFYLNSLYEVLGSISYKFSHFAEKLFFPLINKGTKISLWSLMWVLYYVSLNFFIYNRGIGVHAQYFDIIPFFIMLVSLSMIHQKNTSAFVALMMIYKILESFILYGVHEHEPFKVIGNVILTTFIFLILIYGKKDKLLNKHKKLMGSTLIVIMLYFTNFPFLLQSLVNEHIIEAFLKQDMLMDLGFYCIANTFFNIGLYQYIFNQVYLENNEGAQS